VNAQYFVNIPNHQHLTTKDIAYSIGFMRLERGLAVRPTWVALNTNAENREQEDSRRVEARDIDIEIVIPLNPTNPEGKSPEKKDFHSEIQSIGS
jgi:hypothetical protein